MHVQFPICLWLGSMCPSSGDLGKVRSASPLSPCSLDCRWCQASHLHRHGRCHGWIVVDVETWTLPWLDCHWCQASHHRCCDMDVAMATRHPFPLHLLSSRPSNIFRAMSPMSNTACIEWATTIFSRASERPLPHVLLSDNVASLASALSLVHVLLSDDVASLASALFGVISATSSMASIIAHHSLVCFYHFAHKSITSLRGPTFKLMGILWCSNVFSHVCHSMIHLTFITKASPYISSHVP